MTTDTLTADVLDDAEGFVRAEWLRILTASLAECLAAAHAEMPAARPRPSARALRAAGPDPGDMALPAHCRHRSAVRRRNRRVWPTQRSPPRPPPRS